MPALRRHDGIQPHDLAQAPLNTIARDGIADLFRYVKPKRTGAASPRSRACNTNPAAGALMPVAAARSQRVASAAPWVRRTPASGAETLASPRAPRRDDLAAADSGSPGAKAVTALAHQFARLIGPFHGSHTQLVAAWALKVRMSGAGLLKNALKPACPRLPALEAWRAYTGGCGPSQCDANATGGADAGADRAESPVPPRLRGARRLEATRKAWRQRGRLHGRARVAGTAVTWR